jgi:uncharacterized protein with HEPN domain
MPFERIAKCFDDTLNAITLIQAWVEEAGGAEQVILRDLKARSAIERQLLIISEAAIRLDRLDPTAAPRLAPSVDWSGIRGIGNFIRHKYDDLDTSILIDVISNRLTELRQACLHALALLESNGFLRPPEPN